MQIAVHHDACYILMCMCYCSNLRNQHTWTANRNTELAHMAYTIQFRCRLLEGGGDKIPLYGLTLYSFVALPCSNTSVLLQKYINMWCASKTKHSKVESLKENLLLGTIYVRLYVTHITTIVWGVACVILSKSAYIGPDRCLCHVHVYNICTCTYILGVHVHVYSPLGEGNYTG